MRISAAFPGKFVKADDLGGRELPVTITGVAMEDMPMTGGKKAVVRFHEQDQGLVLNRVNADTLGDAFGDETTNWHGRQIVLFPTTTQYSGKTVAAVRVRIPEGQDAQMPTAAPVTPTPDDADGEVPF